ncbi:MAG: hypothetical protein ACO23R_18725, partial [bacterium]
KVFEEFTQLLGVFSKVFLVANIDTSKKDLYPDGSLRPSVESRKPEAVINAFRSLAMSAELSTALDEGRLKIYPIDLLPAGARSLQAAIRAENAGQSAVESEAYSEFDDGFDRFIQDLSEYLSSNEYFNDLMVDSLKLAKRLRNEISDYTALIKDTFAQKQHQLTHQLQDNSDKLAVLGNVKETDWQTAFSRMYFTLTELVNERIDKNRKNLTDTLKSEIGNWMKSDESLATLLEERLSKPIENQIQADTAAILTQLHHLAGNGTGGADFSQEQTRAIGITDIALNEITSTHLDFLSLEISAPRKRIDIPQADIPLKRGFIDILLMRSHSKVNKLFFGEDGTKSINAINKPKKLKAAGLEKFETACNAFISDALPEIESSYLESALNAYVGNFCTALKTRLADIKSRLEQQGLQLNQDLKATTDNLESFSTLNNSVSAFTNALEVLGEFHI